MLNHRDTRWPFAVLHVLAIVGALAGAWGIAIPLATLGAHLLLLAYGSFVPGTGFFIAHRVHGQPGTLALTYDDGPVPEHTGALLDTLKTEGVKATFFCVGERVLEAPSLAKRIVDEGHAIGAHTHRHPWWWGFLGRERAQGEIEDCVRAIRGVTGADPVLFRPPYGVTSPATAAAIRRSGLEPVAWDLRTFDTVARNEPRLVRRVLGRLDRASIIVMHDHAPGALALTRAIIQRAKRTGTTLVPLAAMRKAHTVALVIGMAAFGASHAQDKPVRIDGGDPLVLRLLERSRNTTSLKAVFTQEKHLAVLTSPVLSGGTIWFQQPGRLRWQVDGPAAMVAVVDGRNVRISEGGQERKVTTAERHAYAAINELIAGIVSGKVLSGGKMVPAFFRAGQDLVVELSAEDGKLAERIASVRLVFDARDLLLRELRMVQANGDRTVTRFRNAVLDLTLPPATFSLP